MELTFAKEPLFPYLWDECQGLFKRHYDEINTNKAIVLDPDVNQYKNMDAAGMIDVHTARHAGTLVGYSFFVFYSHLHYKSSPSAANDLIYLAPEHRKGLTGYKFLKFILAKVKERNPQRIFFHVKPHVDFGRMLERLGAKLFENIYSITLEG